MHIRVSECAAGSLLKLLSVQQPEQISREEINSSAEASREACGDNLEANTLKCSIILKNSTSSKSNMRSRTLLKICIVSSL